MAAPSRAIISGAAESKGKGNPSSAGPWEQLVASLLAQHTALLHKLASAAAAAPPSAATAAAAAAIACTGEVNTAIAGCTPRPFIHTHTRSPALSLGHYARRNWRNRRNRQRKKLRRFYNSNNGNNKIALKAHIHANQQSHLASSASSSSIASLPPVFSTATTATHVRRTLRSVVSVRETHAVAEAQQEKNSRLKEAFGISEYFVEGSSLDPNRRAKEEVARAAAEKQKAAASEGLAADGTAKKYSWVHTPSPSPDRSLSKKDKKEKKKKKKRSRD
ncbi:Serine/arginine repetitive matrix protein 2, partial [Halocaridina rubra]